MATLTSLKTALREKATSLSTPSSPSSSKWTQNPLTDQEYATAYDRFLQWTLPHSTDTPSSNDPFLSSSSTSAEPSTPPLVNPHGTNPYPDFIIPQLTQVLIKFGSQARISVLEIGPGPRSVLEGIPAYLRAKVVRYIAMEKNALFAKRLGERFSSGDAVFPNLRSAVDIRPVAFDVNTDIIVEEVVVKEEEEKEEKEEEEKEEEEKEEEEKEEEEKEEEEEGFTLVLLCHSLYGVGGRKRREGLLQRAIELTEVGGRVVVFHRDDGSMSFDGRPVCAEAACFPTGVVCVPDDDESLDQFASFMVGFKILPGELEEVRKVCRALGRSFEGHQLLFSAPEVMLTFVDFEARRRRKGGGGKLPLYQKLREIETLPVLPVPATKNRAARLHRPAAVITPSPGIAVRHDITWADSYGVSLTVLGGGHSGHCLWYNTIAVDLGRFDQIYLGNDPDGPLVIAGAGCNTGHIIDKTMQHGLTVPLGARPSPGSGLWLQGGIGHLARLHGLTCDAIVGAVVVSPRGHVLRIGTVPTGNHWLPDLPVQVPDQLHDDLLWAIKGAGTNFGIVIAVCFRTYPAPKHFLVRNWIIPLPNTTDYKEQGQKIREFNQHIAMELPRNISADVYLYWENDQIRLGITVFEACTTDSFDTEPIYDDILGPPHSVRTVDSVGLFDQDLYMTEIHGGHQRGKTSSFKRCIFLKDIGQDSIISILLSALEKRPTPLCYFHLVQGGGAVTDVPPEATAFGCRDWDFACVITGVFDRGREGDAIARDVARWVYQVAMDLLPLSTGVYSADLGPDPRDGPLAFKAFGPNFQRLGFLKQTLDPNNMLAYACPLEIPGQPSLANLTNTNPRLIILVTGKEGAGKDYCADKWHWLFLEKKYKAQIASISDATKRQYAAECGADFDRLENRDCKEEHRPKLTAFYREQLWRRPHLPQVHFQRLVDSARDVDVLFITGMRDEAPVTTFGHLAPYNRVIEVRVEASDETRTQRRGSYYNLNNVASQGHNNDTIEDHTLPYRPSLSFTNERGDGSTHRLAAFAQTHLIPFLHPASNTTTTDPVSVDPKSLSTLIPSTPDFPRPGITFRDVVSLSKSPDTLQTVTHLLLARLNQFTCLPPDMGVCLGNHTPLPREGCYAAKDPATGYYLRVVGVETGGLPFASALAARLGEMVMVPIRKGGNPKLSGPVWSVDTEGLSFISSQGAHAEEGKSALGTDTGTDTGTGTGTGRREQRLEMAVGGIISGSEVNAAAHARVVVVDDVLATGKTLVAVVRLLTEKAGVDLEKIVVLVVAEFPAHRGRELLRQRGFGRVNVQSLQIFGGL